MLKLCLLVCLFSLKLLPSLVWADAVAIVIHGGAGTLKRANMSSETEASYRAALREAVTSGYAILTAGGSSTSAVIAAIQILENSPLFNAGKGAVFTHDGTVELDASIMEGRLRNAGAIAGVKRVKNPIVLAEQVMIFSPHVLLAGAGAEEFAAQRGLDMVPNHYFFTERRRMALDRAIAREKQAELNDQPEDTDNADKKGTVGAVALDSSGTISAGTSTGGMTNKRYGRIGDSPIIGAGTYADNRVCGISATGYGEFFIRAAVAHDICARARYGNQTLQQAADAVIHGELKAMGADGGVIGLDPTGELVISFNTTGMYRASVSREGVVNIEIFGGKEKE